MLRPLGRWGSYLGTDVIEHLVAPTGQNIPVFELTMLKPLVDLIRTGVCGEAANVPDPIPNSWVHKLWAT